MKVYVSQGDGRWQCGEKNVQEVGTERQYTLTQPVTLFSEDYYSIKRAIACCNTLCSFEEDYLYVYEFSYMEDGCLSVIIVDAQTAEEAIRLNLKEFLEGSACKCIAQYFKEKNNRRELCDLDYLKIREYVTQHIEDGDFYVNINTHEHVRIHGYTEKIVDKEWYNICVEIFNGKEYEPKFTCSTADFKEVRNLAGICYFRIDNIVHTDNPSHG